MSKSIILELGYEDIELQNALLEIYTKKREDCISDLPEFCSIIIKDTCHNILIAKKGAFSAAPIYYSCLNEETYSSFFIKNVVAINGSPSFCKQKIKNYLRYESEIDNTNHLTFYTDVYRLLPGEAMVCKKGNPPAFTISKVIQGDKESSDKESHLASIREKFIESVQRNLGSYNKIAANLSGGLDSSAVNSIVQKLSEKKILSIYVDTATHQAEEYRFAEIVRNKSHTDLVRLKAGKYKLLEDTRKCIEITGLPETNNLPSSFNRAIINLCVENGVEVLLSGFLGDQVIDYGYGYYKELADKDEWVKLQQTLISHNYPKLSVRQLILKMRLKELYSSFSLKKLFRTDTVLHKQLNYRRIDTITDIGYFLRNSLRKKIHLASHGLHTKIARKATYEDDDIIKKTLDHSQLIKSSLEPDKLRIVQAVYQHIVVEALEQRYLLFKSENIVVGYPFFDKNLLEVTLHSTNEWKIAGGKPRATLREALKEYLPKEIYERTSKATFNQYTLEMFITMLKDFKASCGDSYEHHHVWQFVNKGIFEKIASGLEKGKIVAERSTALLFLSCRVIYLALWLEYYDDTFAQKK